MKTIRRKRLKYILLMPFLIGLPLIIFWAAYEYLFNKFDELQQNPFLFLFILLFGFGASTLLLMSIAAIYNLLFKPDMIIIDDSDIHILPTMSFRTRVIPLKDIKSAELYHMKGEYIVIRIDQSSTFQNNPNFIQRYRMGLENGDDNFTMFSSSDLKYDKNELIRYLNNFKPLNENYKI